jgi:hypothetical protein
MVCGLEGWDKLEYIKELKELINSMGCDKRADIADNTTIQGELF